MKSLICAELHWLQLSLKKGKGNSKVRLHHHHPQMLAQNHHQCCFQCVSSVWLIFSFPHIFLNFNDILKNPKTYNGTERLKCGMLLLRIKTIWIKFQFHHYCLQCISVPNLTLKEVDGGKRVGEIGGLYQTEMQSANFEEQTQHPQLPPSSWHLQLF